MEQMRTAKLGGEGVTRIVVTEEEEEEKLE